MDGWMDTRVGKSVHRLTMLPLWNATTYGLFLTEFSLQSTHILDFLGLEAFILRNVVLN